MGSRVIFCTLLSACAAFESTSKMAWPVSELKEPAPIACDEIALTEAPALAETPMELVAVGLRWPVFPRAVTSWFGIRQDPLAKQSIRFHRGLDVSGTYGASVFAALPGRVSSEGMAGGHGRRVIIDHGNGVSTSYSHLALTLVSANMWIAEGQALGVIGDTGRSTGPHLHFEVLVDGQSVDPYPLLGGRLPEAHESAASFAPPKLPLFRAVASH